MVSAAVTWQWTWTCVHGQGWSELNRILEMRAPEREWVYHGSAGGMRRTELQGYQERIRIKREVRTATPLDPGFGPKDSNDHCFT